MFPLTRLLRPGATAALQACEVRFRGKCHKASLCSTKLHFLRGWFLIRQLKGPNTWMLLCADQHLQSALEQCNGVAA